MKWTNLNSLKNSGRAILLGGDTFRGCCRLFFV